MALLWPAVPLARWAWLWVWLWAGLAAGAASAQTVAVRAGEHADFTRLVMNLPERTPYTLTRVKGGADLVFGDRRLIADTSAVFGRIPKTRLTGISALPGRRGLRLDLACDCPVETFWFADASLVIDIRTPPETPRSAAPAEDAARPRPVRLHPLPIPPPRATVASRMAVHGLRRSRTRAAARMPPRATAALDESRKALLFEIGRAASQGLLTPRPGRRPVAAASATPPPVPSADAPPDPDGPALAPPAGPAAPRRQMRAETSVDRDRRAWEQSGPAADPDTCLPPERVDVAAWGDARPFWQQLAPLRARVLGEFDTPRPPDVQALARLYIFFGFGAEARQVLAELGGGKTPDPVLSAMATILETGSAGSTSVLSGQADCTPMVALWSVLSYPTFPIDAVLDGNAVLRGLSALPAHLRAYLGPVLARRLLAAGYAHEGARILRILDRSDMTTTPESHLLGAEIALAEGDTSSAEAALDTLASRNTGASAEALLRLIDTRLRRGAATSHETALLAGAYAVEYRGQPLGPALAAAHIYALAASGAFDQAFRELKRDEGADPARRATIRATLSDILTRKAPDYEFLHRVLSGSTAPAEGLDPEIGNRIAGRLLSLGFNTAASAYAAPEARGAAARGRKLLRARIALADRRPDQAEIELLGVSGDDADLLRAQARSLAGDHAAARILFDTAGQTEQAKREAWLARDWQWLLRNGDAAQAAIARIELARTQAPVLPEPRGVLATDAAIIEDSRKVRTAIGNLLSAHPLPAQ